jgi:hypothetical protein
LPGIGEFTNTSSQQGRGAKFPRLRRKTKKRQAGLAIEAASSGVLEGLMPFSRLGWRIGIPLIIAFVLLNVGALKFIHDAYPADPFKSEALAKCVAGDPGFVRFFPGDRAQCYARQPRQSRAENPTNIQQN